MILLDDFHRRIKINFKTDRCLTGSTKRTVSPSRASLFFFRPEEKTRLLNYPEGPLFRRSMIHSLMGLYAITTNSLSMISDPVAI